MSEMNPQRDEFLPLGVRRVMYVIGLLSTIVAPLMGVNFPEYQEGLLAAGVLLQGAAIGTALANANHKR